LKVAVFTALLPKLQSRCLVRLMWTAVRNQKLDSLHALLDGYIAWSNVPLFGLNTSMWQTDG